MNNSQYIRPSQYKKAVPTLPTGQAGGRQGFISPLLLALIATLVIGGGAFVYVEKKQSNQPVTATSTAQTADSSTTLTTGWKTYTNTKYGFEFRYPSTWSLGVTTGNALKINLSKELLKVYPHTVAIKWYKNYQDVENGFKYNVQLKKWGYISYGDFYAQDESAHFIELNKRFITESGIPIYRLGNEGGASYLIPLSDNTFIVMETVGSPDVYEVLKSFRPIF